MQKMVSDKLWKLTRASDSTTYPAAPRTVPEARTFTIATKVTVPYQEARIIEIARIDPNDRHLSIAPDTYGYKPAPSARCQECGVSVTADIDLCDASAEHEYRQTVLEDGGPKTAYPRCEDVIVDGTLQYVLCEECARYYGSFRETAKLPLSLDPSTKEHQQFFRLLQPALEYSLASTHIQTEGKDIERQLEYLESEIRRTLELPENPVYRHYKKDRRHFVRRP
jgi:hypothetical protein